MLRRGRVEMLLSNMANVTHLQFFEINGKRACGQLSARKQEQTAVAYHIGKRAVVIGAGVAGLSAAGVLAPYFQHVVILERDRLPPYIAARPGAPQGRHPHGLLAGGLKALEEIFPGYKSSLLEAGAVSVNVARDLRYERADVGTLPHRDLGISLLCASRPLIEFVLRRQIDSLANVEIRSECRVTDILSTSSSGAVQGVRFVANSEASSSLQADLVIDASGRGALTAWLFENLGLEAPAVSEVGVDIHYSTAVVKLSEPTSKKWKVVLTHPDPPISALHGLLIPIEGDRWMATFCQRGRVERINSWDMYLSAFKKLVTRTIHDALRDAKPVEDFLFYGFPISSWTHFERMSRMPRGLLPIGDTFCRFNPIHGQGMSSAALQARLLADVLHRSVSASDQIAALQKGFLARVASVLETPWAMSTNSDLLFPEVRDTRPAYLEEGAKFEAALFRAAVVDPIVHRAAIEVGQLLQPRALLQAPHIKQRIEAANVRG